MLRPCSCDLNKWTKRRGLGNLFYSLHGDVENLAGESTNQYWLGVGAVLHALQQEQLVMQVELQVSSAYGRRNSFVGLESVSLYVKILKQGWRIEKGISIELTWIRNIYGETKQRPAHIFTALLIKSYMTSTNASDESNDINACKLGHLVHV